MREYLVIYEPGEDGGWSAYAPDLPGLGIVGECALRLNSSFAKALLYI